MAAAGRIMHILGTEPSIRDPDEHSPAGPIRGRVSLVDLTFRYPSAPPAPGATTGEGASPVESAPAEPVLGGIDLEIPAGSTVAVVGRTGSGKSTLVSLLPRLHDPPEGTLFIDGVDVRSLPLSALRGAIGFVPQETFLFSDTIESNIVYGGKGGGLDPETAARLAGMEQDMASFPEGYETVIGERGITLSGGQKQRTALARALARDPRILILDDAFSSVDASTEQAILDNLLRVKAGRTTIIVTHRLSSITHADLIVLLEDGRVAERGTHAELLGQDGIYAEMFRRQDILRELEEDRQ
jgi:ATP-binding cassette subfamily B protein